MKSGVINPKDREPYYPHYDPALHPQQPKKRYQIKKKPAVYALDDKAYYGPQMRYQTIASNRMEGTETKIIMKDLSDIIPSKEKIQELQKQLNNINNFIMLPKNMMMVDKDRRPYFNDPSAYYDPTQSDLIKKKKSLIKRVNYMTEQLKKMEENKGEIPNPFRYEKVPENYIENRTNANIELYNKGISDMLSDEKDTFSYNYKSTSAPAPSANSVPDVKNAKGLKTNLRGNVNANATPNWGKNIGGISFKTISKNY